MRFHHTGQLIDAITWQIGQGMRGVAVLIALAPVVFCTVKAFGSDSHDRRPTVAGSTYWIAPGQGGSLPALVRYHDGVGDVEVLFARGPVDVHDNAFFAPLGSNGRACVTCHLLQAKLRQASEALHGEASNA